MENQLRVITWNIQCGCDDGSGLANGWARRKVLLGEILCAERFDILCVQEALPGQLAFLTEILPGFGCVSFPRDSFAGEHGAIFFRMSMLECADSGRFWLSDTPEQPGPGWDRFYRRICMWADLRDSRGENPIRIFNTHFPLRPSGGVKAAWLLATRSKPHGNVPTLLCGDFNCGPKSETWSLLQNSGLRNTESACGKLPGTPTFQRFGFSACFDAVFASANWRVLSHRVIGSIADSHRPSDHSGVCVEVVSQRYQH
jgi:endonuclease/exonuclease/phosphatase family metal-dependent hydrolase